MTYEHPDWSEDREAYQEQVRARRDQDEKDEKAQLKAEYEADILSSREEGRKLKEEREDAQRRVIFEPLTNFSKESNEWVLHHKIPSDDLTLIIGKGNVGKSTLLTLLCAYITNGVHINGERYPGGDRPIIYCHSEDSVEKTIKPRMEAAGVNEALVHLVRVETPGGEGMLQIPRDIDRLMQGAKGMGAAAIFYDPISSFLQTMGGGRNDADAMRKAYLAIQSAHSEYGIAGIGLGHTRKAMSDSLLDAFMGSSEQTNVIRSAIGAIPDPDVPGRYIISQEKHNRAPWSKSYSYRIQTVPGIYDDEGRELEDISRIIITGTTTETCSDVLRSQPMPARREAKRFLIQYINEQGGSGIASEVVDEASKKGHAKATVYRAAEDLIEYGKLTSIPDQVDRRRHVWSLAIDLTQYENNHGPVR
jgi:hypothetical protein